MTRSRKWIGVVMGLGMVLAGFSSVLADRTNWKVTLGNWNVSSNWDNNTPTASVMAYITNKGTCNIIPGDTNYCSTLYLGNSSGTDNSTINMTGGSLTCTASTNEWIGYKASCSFNQSGGTNSMSGSGNYFYVGYNSVNGTTKSFYNLTGTGILNVPINERIGYMDNGTITQDSQSSHTAANLYIGMWGGTGTYQMNNGTFTVTGTMYVGAGGTVPQGGIGIYNQTGGNVTINSLKIGGSGTSSGSPGTCSISGGTDNITSAFDIGGGSLGTVNIIGSAATISTNSLNINNTYYDNTTINSQFDAGGISTIKVTNTGLNVAKLCGRWNIINPGGVAPVGKFNLVTTPTAGGILIQPGFTVNLPAPPTDNTTWTWGYDNATSPKALWVQHGNPTATPTFTPDGGSYSQLQLPVSVTFGCSTLGAVFYYTTDGSTPTTASSSAASVQITGNTTLKAIAVAPGYFASDVKTATYSFSLSDNTTRWNVADGDWSGWSNWTQGVPAGGMSAYVANGGIARISQPGAVCSNLYVSLSNVSGNVEMSGGDLTCTTGNEYISWKASATFHQTGGTNQLNGALNYLYVGFNDHAGGTSSTYTLEGTGVLTGAYYERIAYYDNGTFIQDGQSSHSGKYIYMGMYGGTATYQLKNGTFTADQLYCGNGGPGIFTQTGGSFTPGYLFVGRNSAGSYTISGGTLNVTTQLLLGYDGGYDAIFNIIGDNASITCGNWCPSILNWSGAALNCQFNATGISTINVTNNAYLGGTLTVTDPSNVPLGRYNLFTVGGTVSGTFAAVNLPDAATWTWGIDNASTPKTIWVQHGVPAATPVLGPDNGVYFILTAPQAVTLGCSTPGAVIHYTLDGSDPTQSSATYSGPITIDHNLTLKAGAWASGYVASAIKTATFSFPTVYNQPNLIPYGTATLTGNPDTDFAGATWAPLNRTYYTGTPAAADVSEAWYTARWTKDTVTLAVKVLDHNQSLNDSYALGWNQQDDVEIYLHTTGTGPTAYTAGQVDAQEYTVGIKSSDPASVWSVVGNGNAVPAWAGFQAIGRANNYLTTGDGWLYYEVVLKPFKAFSLTDSGSVTASPLAIGNVIGLDVLASTKDWSGGFLMLSENLLNVPTLYKSADYRAFGLHKLASSSAQLAAVLAAMDSKSGDPAWNADADLDGDGVVTSTDLSIVLANMQ